jgi:hypothetical protein
VFFSCLFSKHHVKKSDKAVNLGKDEGCPEWPISNCHEMTANDFRCSQISLATAMYPCAGVSILHANFLSIVGDGYARQCKLQDVEGTEVKVIVSKGQPLSVLRANLKGSKHRT